MLLDHEGVVALDLRRCCEVVVSRLWGDTSELFVVDLGALRDNIVATVVKVNERLLEHASYHQVLLTVISAMLALTRLASVNKAEIGNSVVERSIGVAGESVLVSAKLLLFLPDDAASLLLKLTQDVLLLIDHLNLVVAIVHSPIVEDVLGELDRT